jgi:hypothetical protein
MLMFLARTGEKSDRLHLHLGIFTRARTHSPSLSKATDTILKWHKPKKERVALLEAGFEWVGEDDTGLTYFRKRK